MVSRPALAAALAFGLSLASAAQAQYFLRPLNAEGIGKAEWSQLSAAAKKLYHPEVKAEGAAEQWSTPSGAAGTVTLEKVETRADGATCVVLRHEVMTPKLSAPMAGSARRCRQPNGTWLISAQ